MCRTGRQPCMRTAGMLLSYSDDRTGGFLPNYHPEFYLLGGIYVDVRLPLRLVSTRYTLIHDDLTFCGVVA